MPEICQCVRWWAFISISRKQTHTKQWEDEFELIETFRVRVNKSQVQLGEIVAPVRGFSVNGPSHNGHNNSARIGKARARGSHNLFVPFFVYSAGFLFG